MLPPSAPVDGRGCRPVPALHASVRPPPQLAGPPGGPGRGGGEVAGGTDVGGQQEGLVYDDGGSVLGEQGHLVL